MSCRLDPTSLDVGIYVEGLSHARKLLFIWQAAASLGMRHIVVDVLAWGAPVPRNATTVQSASLLSDAVVPLEILCKSVVLRVLVPGSLALKQQQFLDEDLRYLRESRLKAMSDSVLIQLLHCSLFSMLRSRPPIMLPYARDMIFEYAERIWSCIHRRPEAGYDVIASGYDATEDFWAHLPLKGVDATGKSETCDHENGLAIWKWWVKLKLSVNCMKSVGVALEISEDIPGSDIVDLWLSEPIRSVVIPTSIFFTSDKGTPELSIVHKSVISRFLRLSHIRVSLRPGGIMEPENVSKVESCFTFIQQLYQEVSQGVTLPLGPCCFPPMDTVHVNLPAAEYDLFELDTTKYEQYEYAIRQYLTYRQSLAEVPEIFVAAVVGCGRGPLVSALLSAADACYASFRVYAVEKNPITLKVLQLDVMVPQSLITKNTNHGQEANNSGKLQIRRDRKCLAEWAAVDVIVVMEDMRTWKPPEKLDLLLSEMLGSFGDNELCPEMLARPEKFLADDGVSIPQQYTSVLAPVSAAKLYELTSSRSEERTRKLRQMVYACNVDHLRLLAEPKEVFIFHHPSVGVPGKARFVQVKFVAHSDGLLHGFSGYFRAILYGDVEQSLVQGGSTDGLITWNNIFFPLVFPCRISRNDTICLQFWRRSDAQFVWYEWALVEPCLTLVHNIGGAIYRMPLAIANAE